MRTHLRNGIPAGANRQGFATMMVITSMVFLAAAVIGLTTLFAHEVRRTRAALAETQLRQLLQAGVPAAIEELAANGPGERDIPLSSPVEGAALSIHFAPETDGVDARIGGTFRSFKAAQVVHFSRTAGGEWQLAAVRLEQTGQQ